MTSTSSITSLCIANFQAVDMTPNKRDWWDRIPGKPGWYAVETDAPLSVIAKVPSPREQGMHYQLAKRLSDVQFLIDKGVAIIPADEGALYIVYSGEHANLKSRAREHTHGNKGTGCICLSQYESLCEHRWKFYFLTCEQHVPGSSGNKALRTYLQQKWRGEHGWPILCAQ